MSHALANIDGRYSYAFTGERSDIWHREGMQMPDGSTVEEMAAAAGFDFKLCPTRVRYNVGNDAQKTFDGKVVLVHSVTRDGLAVVGSDFQIVQPSETVKLAERVAAAVGGHVDSCGVTFSGLGLFINIRAGEAERIVGSDVMMPNILFATRNDGSMRTCLKASNIRAVCNNTVSAALGSDAHARDFSLSHRSKFDSMAVADFWEDQYRLHKVQVEKFRELAETPVRKETAEAVIFSLFNNQRPADKRQDPTSTVLPKGGVDIRNTAGYVRILSMFNGTGLGATMPGVKGTAWGLFNAVTEYVDHHARAKDASQRWINANFGKGVDLKSAAFDALHKFAHAGELEAV